MTTAHGSGPAAVVDTFVSEPPVALVQTGEADQ